MFGAHRQFAKAALKNDKLFDKILIANRGEIALRVIRTAKRLGVKTVAVYSDADRYAQHVLQADEAVHIGPAPASESYLVGEKIIQACRDTGAQAVHPGYGFLSENLAFCQLCTENDIVFIGPPPKAILAMGSKSESKDIMIQAGVPVTPGYHGNDNSNETLLREAKKIGFPLMIKAVSGGGGKGMRLVHEEKDFLESLESCQREAEKSFKDRKVLIEKLVRAPRHVELQVFGDTFGNAVHLLERDCSVQRRHQKVLEEAPAVNLDPKQREAMGNAAVACCKAVGYVGAGTVEFLIDTVSNDFYFCEMNTRLQVEHPVTEMITGTDLVEWQLKVAAGQPLPMTQEQIWKQAKGYAIEARIYAENPLKSFLPASGYLAHLRPPTEINIPMSHKEEGVRVDSGVIAGDTVSTFYDPMIAKLIVYDENRPKALEKLERSLREYQVAGMANNIDFIIKILRHKGFSEAQPTTAFFDQYMTELLASLQQVPLQTLPTHAVLGLLGYYQSLNPPQERKSLWEGAGEFDSWRAIRTVNRSISAFETNHEDLHSFDLEIKKQGNFTLRTLQPPQGDDKKAEKSKVAFSAVEKSCRVISAKKIAERIAPQSNVSTVVMECVAEMTDVSSAIKVQQTATVSIQTPPHLTDPITIDVWLAAQMHDEPTHYQFKINQAVKVLGDSSIAGNPLVLSPMPGKVVKVLAKDGDVVKKGDRLVILEAMKMEHVVFAPCDGIVSVYCAEGSPVGEGSKLAEVLPPPTK